MAKTIVPATRLTLTDDDTVFLVAPSETFVGTWVVRLEGDGLTGTVDVQGRPARSSATWQNIDYRVRTAVADPVVTQLTNATIGSGIILEINAAGLDVQLDCAVSAGSLFIDAAPPLFG